jgi:hypothetical protein
VDASALREAVGPLPAHIAGQDVDRPLLAQEAGHARLGLVVSFSGTVRRWREDKPGGLAVVDIPSDLVVDLGGRRQVRVTGTLNDAPFTGSTMLVAGGGMCVGVSKAALAAASARIGDEVRLSITPAST